MKSAGFIFGRMNPITIGHMEVIKTLDSLNVDDKFIYLSHTQDKKKNPLPYESKIAYVTAILKFKFPDIKVVKSERRRLVSIIFDLYDAGYRDVQIVMGSDDVAPIQLLIDNIKNYIPTDGSEPKRFENISIVKAGQDRDENGEGVASVSATKVRKLAKEGNFEEFKKFIPSKDPYLIKALYDELRMYLT